MAVNQESTGIIRMSDGIIVKRIHLEWFLGHIALLNISYTKVDAIVLKI